MKRKLLGMTVNIGGDLPNFKNAEKTFTEMCAEFQNTILRNGGYSVSGNAWNLNNADLIYSGYDPSNRPENYNKKTVQKYNYNAANSLKKNFNLDSLDKDNVYIANMYYNGSPFQEQAYNEGRDSITGTHTGYIQYDQDTNTWEITHNIHGTIYKEPLQNILGSKNKYGVTAIYQPKQKSLLELAKDKIGITKESITNATKYINQIGTTTK